MEKKFEFFQKFEVGYIQTCTSLKSIMWYPKGDHHSVLSPFHQVIIKEAFINYIQNNLVQLSNNAIVKGNYFKTWNNILQSENIL
jgi:hypothetical protein